MLKIGLAKKEITPPVGPELCGYGYHLKRQNVGVSDQLYVRSTAFVQDEKRYLLVNCDLEGVDTKYYDIIKAAIANRLQLSPDDMLLAVIHTHTAPAFYNLCGCGEADPDYVEWAKDVIIDCACEAFCELREVTGAKVSSIDVPGFGYDRTYSDIKLNTGLRALTFEFAEGKPYVLLNYGCHPVSYGIANMVSAEYPGACIAALEKVGYDANFLVGFCGDVDPADKRDYNNVLQKGGLLAEKYLESMKNAVAMDDLTMKWASMDANIKLNIQTEEMIGMEVARYMESATDANRDAFVKVTGVWTDVNRKRLAGELPETELVHLRFLTIGKVLIAGISAEVTTELGDLIAEEFPEYIVFTMGNLFDTRRYIASNILFDKYTYEGMHSTFAYGTTPIVKGEGERMIAETCAKAKKIMA